MRPKNFLNGLLTMKANHDKCHLLMSTFTPNSIKVKDYIIKNSDYGKLLGVTVDTKLNFDCHFENILKKASKNIHVLARIPSRQKDIFKMS